ncbi:TPA: lipid-A-disaccharide synthase [Candidatus Delongbacteria bacterium]|nr:MAG: lipid-A-disaccharide synthase [Candidatus Delongbacteria bacterium GWF2_40_14]HAQ61652.1 lipid-A-disaccharide synthase [Candidatus Delongbacteria bacterium]
MMNKNLLYITAGEESGDMLGGEVMKALRTSRPDIIIKGIGGKKMTVEGLLPVFRTEKLGFMGFYELIRHYFVIKKAFRAISESIIIDKPAAVLMIDFSEFHIKLAKKIKSALPETKIIKYVSPQVWASRPKRIDDIVRFYDCLCCILPFEKEIYKDHKIDCRFVGHPLLDKYRINLLYDEFIQKFGLSEEKTLISIFPGSRKQEISKHMPVIKEFIEAIKSRQDIELIICRSSNIKESVLKRYGLPGSVRIISSDYQWEIMSYSGVILCKSGTSTLQTAIVETPSIVFYKVNTISFFIAKMIVKTKFISLPNIIAGKQINPELIQSDFTSENLVSEVNTLLNNDDIYNLRKNELKAVNQLLGEQGASAKVAAAVLDYI